jgi:hypothetical protein
MRRRTQDGPIKPSQADQLYVSHSPVLWPSVHEGDAHVDPSSTSSISKVRRHGSLRIGGVAYHTQCAQLPSAMSIHLALA